MNIQSILKGLIFTLGGQVARKEHRGDNPHLNTLYTPQMPEILAQMQIAPPPRLPAIPNRKWTPRRLPEPVQETQYMPGDKFKERLVEQYRVLRQASWDDPVTPPMLLFCPQNLYVINEPNELFKFAVKEIESQSMIGISIQGQNLGRKGL